MAEAARKALGEVYLTEISKFGSFSKGAQRYIRRSIDVGLARRDAVRRWARDPGEAGEICQQARHYRRLDDLRGHIPEDAAIEEMEPLMAPLVTLTAFDLGA